jgi:hypothetical protein
MPSIKNLSRGSLMSPLLLGILLISGPRERSQYDERVCRTVRTPYALWPQGRTVCYPPCPSLEGNHAHGKVRQRLSCWQKQLVESASARAGPGGGVDHQEEHDPGDGHCGASQIIVERRFCTHSRHKVNQKGRKTAWQSRYLTSGFMEKMYWSNSECRPVNMRRPFCTELMLPPWGGTIVIHRL